MEGAYQPAAWQPLWATVAGSSAALLGLLFVGLSVNVRAVVGEPSHRARAREALGLLRVLVVLSILNLVPVQSTAVLGFELLALGAVLVGLSVRLQGQTLRRTENRARFRWALRTTPFNLATLAVPVSGVSLLLGAYGGLSWLVPTVLIYLCWSVINAWTLVVSAAVD